MLDPNKIIFHCSATRPDWMETHSTLAKTAQIDAWHRSRRFNQIGYHYVIDRDGFYIPARPLWRQGAHTRGQNRHSIGVCLIGGYGGNENDAFLKHFTKEQRKSSVELIDTLREYFSKPLTVHGHNEFAAKACPSFNVQKEFRGLV